MHSRHPPNDPPQDLTSPATQVVTNRAAYLGDDQTELGRRIAPDKVELFAAADAALAVRQELARRQPEFIAVHDVGASGSLRLLGSISAALGTPVQQLAIRREGQGVPLAMVRFVEIPGRHKRTLRVYSTDIDADTQARQQIAVLLVGHSRLAALLIGQLPSHVLASSLQPLRQAIQGDAWHNQHLLLVPSSAQSDLRAHADSLRGPSGPQVEITAPATGLSQAWSIVAGAWNQIREGRRRDRGDLTPAPPSSAAPATDSPIAAAVAAAVSAAVTAASTRQMRAAEAPETAVAPAPATSPGSAPAPAAPSASATASASVPADGSATGRAARPASAGGAPVARAGVPLPPARPAPRPDNPLWARYLAACGEVKGLISACLMDVHGASLLAHIGARPGPAALVEQGLAIYNAIARSGQALGLGTSQPDASIALTAHHLLLHPLPGHPGTVLHAVLDGSIANLTLARMHLQRVDTAVLGAKAPV